MLDELRQMANQRDVTYQSLIKVFLREWIDTGHSRNLAVNEKRAPCEISRKKAGRKYGAAKKNPFPWRKRVLFELPVDAYVLIASAGCHPDRMVGRFRLGSRVEGCNSRTADRPLQV